MLEIFFVGCQICMGHTGISWGNFTAAEYSLEEENGEESWGMIDHFDRKRSLELLQI